MTKQQAALLRILERGGKFRSRLVLPFIEGQKVWFCSNVEIVGFDQCPEGIITPSFDDFVFSASRLVKKQGDQVMIPNAEQL